MIFRRLPGTGPGYLAPVADEAGRTGRPPTGDEAGATCGRYALGEFAITPRRALDDERPPGLLGERYEVGRLIGSGGTARVYRAYDTQLNREVAVKIYDRDAVALDQRRRLREMTIQGSISHPGVVALLDSGTEHGRTYLVMQLVEGENLAERLLSGPLPASEVLALADGLAEALAHVHARRIVHRDLKPANVFLSANGPLIGDFGIAHALDATHITGTGLIPGTAAYLAPEQVSGEPAGPPADVYALGLILLECLTGQREYPGTMVEAAMARLTRPPRVPEDVPAALAYTLRRMTQREPADRPTAAKVPDMLHAPPPTLPWSRPGRSPRWRRRSAAAAGRHDAVVSPSPAHGGAALHDTTAALSPARGEPGSAGAITPGGAANPGTARGAAAHEAAITPGGAASPGVPADGEPATAVASPAGPPGRRRLVAAAGLTAAAVAALSAVLLVDREAGTGTPAQPPAANPPAVSATSAASSTPFAEPGTRAPRPGGTGGSGAQPGTGEPASLEPAAETRETPSPAEQPTKSGKPPKTDPPGKTKGKGPGHDS
ncbi:protein kinase [Amycolatopsis sp. MtRt-6]|uniref:serine/threonine-protein kinase n=1 Tax=Amycolatopsis sp. MtRt-6 TaxID=2792782 RepID=UPI0027DB6146|nr:protein kinase [Amycolatopsis sp. MtRt-6]